MARSTPSKTAARTAARQPRRTPRARAAAAPADKAVEADIARAAEHAPAAHAAHPHGPEAFGAAIGGFLNSLSGLQVPLVTHYTLKSRKGSVAVVDVDEAMTIPPQTYQQTGMTMNIVRRHGKSAPRTS